MIPKLPYCRPAHGKIVRMKLKKYDTDYPDLRDMIEEEIDRFYNEGGNNPETENNLPRKG